MNCRDPREIRRSLNIHYKSKWIFDEKSSSSLTFFKLLNVFKLTFWMDNLNRFAWFLQHSNRLVNSNSMQLITFWLFKANSVVTYQTVEIPRFKCDQISLATDNSVLVRQKNKLSDSWTLKEIISSQYNRGGTTRCTNRSVLFLIEKQRTKEVSLFYINRVNKMSVR